MPTNKDQSIQFLSEPILIKEENKMIVYRFNEVNKSPYSGDYGPEVVWNYAAKSAKTNIPEGIFAMQKAENFLIPLLLTYALSPEKDEIVVVKLEIDKTKIIRNNPVELSFPQCNIIQVLTLDNFIALNMPHYTPLVEQYHILRAYQTEENKKMFMALYEMKHPNIELEKIEKDREEALERLRLHYEH